MPGAASLAQIERERAEAKAREERELSERLAHSQRSDTPTPTSTRATPTRFLRSSLSTDSPTALKKSLDHVRPGPSPHSPSPSLSSAKSSPVLLRYSSHDPSPNLFRRQTSRDLHPEHRRASMTFTQSASAPAANLGADVPAILTEVPVPDRIHTRLSH